MPLIRLKSSPALLRISAFCLFTRPLNQSNEQKPVVYGSVDAKWLVDVLDSLLPHHIIDFHRFFHQDSFTGTSITYAQLFELGARFGRGLPSTFPDLFPSPDPRVVTIFSPNALLYPVVTLGVLKANDVLPSESGPVIVSTTNAALTSYECAQQWEASTASLLIVHPSLLDKAVEAWNLQLGRPLERIVLLDESGVLDSKPCLVSSVHKTVYQILATGEQLSANNHSRSASAEPLTPVCPSPPPDSNEDSNEPPHVPAFILFSSGTTSGKSKPIVISHYNVVGVLISMTAAETRKNAAGEQAIYPGEDVVLGTVPTFHAFGMFNVLWHAMYLRVKVIMFSRFDADKVIEAFDTHSINYGFVVPPMLIAISARTPPAGQHPSLRWLMSAAAPLLEEVITKARAYFGRNAVRNGMGMTELVATAIATAPGEPLSEGRAGVLNPNNEALIIDPKTGMEAGYNYPGELYIRGPQVVREFWGGGKDGEMLDISGFLHSGDIATVSEDGTFFIRDRLKVRHSLLFYSFIS